MGLKRTMPKAGSRSSLGRRTRRILTKVSNRYSPVCRANIIPGLTPKVALRVKEGKGDSGPSSTVDPRYAHGPGREVIGGMSSSAPNLCYMKTGLQALAATSYARWIATKAALEEAEIYRPITCRLDVLVPYKRQHEITVAAPLTCEVALEDLGEEQHGAVELITRLNERLVKENGYEDNLMQLEVVQRTCCLDCGHTNWDTASHTTLRLQKPTANRAGLSVDVANCLNFHCRVGPRGGDSIRCNRCVLLGVWEILTLALKRPRAPELTKDSIGEIRRRRALITSCLRAGSDFSDENLWAEVKLKRRTFQIPTKRNHPESSDAELETLLAEYRANVDSQAIKYGSSWSEAFAISKLPQVLVLEFENVGTWRNIGGTLAKNRNRVVYQPTQDFFKFVVGDERETNPLLQLVVGMPGGEEAGDSAASESGDKMLYELRSVMVHRGPDIDVGHWVCFRREWLDDDLENPVREQWWLCNEGSTMRVPKAKVFGKREDPQRGGSMYALVYERLAAGAVVKDNEDANLPAKVNWKLDTGI
ncbi:hypothetical protein DRE_01819 [Drechslerella stenobrocha 248]|uniref:ubiquitinyl hydrolase 1 n=1 Tax=Drechslerella stenobrocha 248 TaxID=1043628 RepID=W7I955_9PEZI|nr:hypothetical protein DRE_01819 [Drechslerella stenobrocha 248]